MYDGLVAGWKRNRAERLSPRDSGLIPTWQVGIEQPQSSDPRRYITDGYGKNSLLFSCIAEKATSFASLKAQVVRRGGIVAGEHRVSRLLANPNTYQDGLDFAEMLVTQLEAAGNAYIEKVRVSDDAGRRSEFATYPVQALELVRPDYVTIDPGGRREDDVFVIRIGGQERRRIPRRDMIHIHEPLVINDFYGEPKIARLVRELSVDLQMSDFELAFFRNAGVPMGMLSVKGITSEDETAHIKGRFRSAYNGVRKWFELLVLNSDQATYTPMGFKQNEMEMDSTRFHVESRTCAVFGVPPVIVGARVAMHGDGALAYEEAQHALWAETMVPLVQRIAGAWTKFLLPEFAVQADRGAEVAYDLTVVRALQEDRSRKLREVVRLVLTGGFTVNQALTLVGLPTQPDGDFYVRNGNQVIVSADGTIVPMSGSDGGGGPNLDHPLEGAARLEAAAAVAEAERLTIFRRPGE